jgi:hypothetical protein
MRCSSVIPPKATNPEEKTMLKAPLIAAFLASVAFSPAFAQDLCNDAHMKQMDGMIAKMTDPAQQKKATTALDQSKAAMKAGNNAECMKYMNEPPSMKGGRRCEVSCSGTPHFYRSCWLALQGFHLPWLSAMRVIMPSVTRRP